MPCRVPGDPVRVSERHTAGMGPCEACWQRAARLRSWAHVNARSRLHDSYMRRSVAAWRAFSLGLRPPVRPRARAASRPSRVPSTISSRSPRDRVPGPEHLVCRAGVHGPATSRSHRLAERENRAPSRALAGTAYAQPWSHVQPDLPVGPHMLPEQRGQVAAVGLAEQPGPVIAGRRSGARGDGIKEIA